MRRFFDRTFLSFPLLFLALFCLLQAQPAQAHPHSFISLQTKVHFKNDKMTGLTFAWTMDAMTSADILYDLEGLDETSKAWKKMSSNIMVNVLSNHYFSLLYVDGALVSLYPLPDHHRLIRDEQQKNQLILEFTVSLTHPIDLPGKKIELFTYDPSFYVDMSYPNSDNLLLPEAMLDICQVELIQPHPSASLIAYAASFDMDESIEIDDQFGRNFAQQVVITCNK